MIPSTVPVVSSTIKQTNWINGLLYPIIIFAIITNYNFAQSVTTSINTFSLEIKIIQNEIIALKQQIKVMNLNMVTHSQLLETMKRIEQFAELSALKVALAEETKRNNNE